jgi:uncharacterized protein with NRDE domain
MKNPLSVIIFAGIAIAGGAYWYHSHIQRKESEKRGQVVAAETNKQVGDLAARSGAVTDWRQRIVGTDWQEDGYSIELQDTLGTVSGKPVLVEGTIADIFRRGKRSYIVISDVGLDSVWFVVECDTSQTDELKKARPRHPRAAFVVQVNLVEKDKLKLETSSEPDDEGGREDVTEIARGSDEFFVHGRCLGFLVESESR